MLTVSKSGSLNPLEPSGPVKAYTGIALAITFHRNILFSSSRDYRSNETARVWLKEEITKYNTLYFLFQSCSGCLEN
jgi:hypothetical protein